ncbi:MAG: hypothetical protein NC905_03035 [Candidatus Omnitrophica bacterium]|nr:hypothetical protein [Candidatus Omnitrophota bacterium]
MNETIFAYSLIKTIYETSKDYLDVFVPFILISFPEGRKEVNIEALSKEIKEKTGLEVPIHALNTIITRAVRTGYLTRKQNKCFLTDKGYKAISQIISKREEERRQINSLIEDVKSFIRDKYSVALTSEEILAALDLLIKKCQLSLIIFFNPKAVEEEKFQTDIDKNDYYSHYLAEYLRLARDQKPDAFNTLQRVFYGAIIFMVVKRENGSEINKKFSKLQIFLDTNFMFSITDLHYPGICKPAKQLFNLLKKYNFQLKVFDFTINEMVRVLQGYMKESHKYFPTIKVDSIYSNLKAKGWTSENCIQFISKIEQKIGRLGIQIEYTGIDLNKWEIPNDNRYKTISTYKLDQNPLGQKHDICSIEKIKGIRRRPQREIEKCIALFLTSDLKLSKFDFIELGHKDNFTVCEVISDKFLTTLLWLKNPKTIKELPLEMILSIQSEILIDRVFWDKFYDTLIKLKKDGKISEEDIATLVYYHQIQQDLAVISDFDKSTPEFVLEEIEKSKREIDEDTKRKIAEEKKKLEEKYTEEMAKRDKQNLERIENIKSKLRKKADRIAKICANLIWFIPVIPIIIIGIVLLKLGIFPTIIKSIMIYAPFISSVLSILSFLGIKIDIFHVKNKIYDWRFNSIYKKLLFGLGIEEDKK